MMDLYRNKRNEDRKATICEALQEQIKREREMYEMMAANNEELWKLNEIRHRITKLEHTLYRVVNKHGIIFISVITCPFCQYKKEEMMPVDACQYFYECENCHQRLSPKPGDCCVFCSYGTVPCPSIQEEGIDY